MKQLVFYSLLVVFFQAQSIFAMPSQDNLPWPADFETKSMDQVKAKNLEEVEKLCPKEPEACEWLVNFYSQVVSDSKNGGQLSTSDPQFEHANKILDETYSNWCTSIELGDACRRYLSNVDLEVAVPKIKAAQCKEGEFCKALVGFYENRSETKNLLDYLAGVCQSSLSKTSEACSYLKNSWPVDCHFKTPLSCKGLVFKEVEMPVVYQTFEDKLEKGDRNELLGVMFAFCFLISFVLMISFRLLVNRTRLTRLQFQAWRWSIYSLSFLGLAMLLFTGSWILAIFYFIVTFLMIFDKILLKLFCSNCFHTLTTVTVGHTKKSVDIMRVQEERDWRGTKIADLITPGKGYITIAHLNTSCARCGTTFEHTATDGEIKV